MNLAGFAQQPVPLPPIDEQRRIVAQIEQLALKITEARGLRDRSIAEIRLMSGLAQRRIFPMADGTRVGDFANIQSGYAFKSEWFTDSGIRLARNVNIGHGKLQWTQIAYMPMERRHEFSRFDLNEGDILITLDRPIIATGVKVARVKRDDLPSLLLQRVGRVQLRNGAILPEYLFAWLQSPLFVDAIDPGRSNGVPHISPKDVERIPFCGPPVTDQRRIVAYLADLSNKTDALKQLQVSTAAELDALLPSILDREFNGKL